jgi:hypothetical protein
VIPDTPVPTDSASSPGAVSANDVNVLVDGLREHGLDQQITGIVVYTTGTDPTHQMGRPGSYIARLAFTDVTIAPRDRTPAAPTGSITSGGSLEVFRTGQAATASAGHEPDRVPGEHDLLSAGVLLRLSPTFGTAMVTRYRTALRETTGQPVQQAG